MDGIPFPAIDPVAFEIGPFVVRWYALAYLAGFIGGWRYCIHLARVAPVGPTPQDMDDFLTWAVIGTILGGRLGYVLFYNLPFYLENPLEALKVWHGGMSFHGGLLGVILAMILFALRRGFSPFAIGDIVAAAAPIGLFFGRLANFVNGELYGRATDLPWGVVFPHGGPLPRHPSQLYEAVLEGLVLFILLLVLAHRQALRRRPGIVGGVFLIGYGVSRFLVEFVREPDAHLGFLWLGATMGQLLSLPMIAVGLAFVWRGCARPPAVERAA
ncbi:MAG TPA: prolipoprotein diacylglyceryl transferase [Alphaproteobacteria bacterium]|nr:prolipoprotein diacylglyceryl transferase [Alphaproteobacteria bacterium]